MPRRLTLTTLLSIVALLLIAPISPIASAQTYGQFDESTQKVINSLAPSARPVIARLSTLGLLPDEPWRTHSGDIAHGETLNLDDSGWQQLPLATQEKRVDKLPQEAIWFRRTITVPKTLNGYDLTGARIWFQFNSWVNGQMPEIFYFNGRRVALGEDLEPIVLFESAKPGDSIQVAVKLLHTEDQKTFAGAKLRVEFPNSRPNPEAIREEFLSAALLVPSLSRNDPAQFAIVNDAIATVDLKALDAGDQSKFDASLTAAIKKLEGVRPLLETATLHLTGNSHIDAAWLWPWTETVDVVKRTFGTALQLMYEYPEYTYTQSAAQYNEWMAEKYPDINREIAKRIKEGRWEIVGGMWVEPDLNMPDGESLVRQLLVGKRWFKQQYGVDVRIGWNPDSFGYTWQLPQIYKKSGVDYFVTQKIAWNDTNQMPFKLFWWESPDGSKVLSYFPHDYANGNLNPYRLTQDLKTARERATGMTEMLDLYGVGDHGGGPTRSILDEGFGWKDATPKAVLPKIEFGLAQPYFTAIEKKIAPESPTWDYKSIAKGYTAPAEVEGKVAIPTWKSELYFEYHRGVMTTQAQHKKNMRESEVEVLNAEKFSSLAWLYGREYPAKELTEDWKKVLLNQFHDLAAGSGIGVIYKDAQKDYDVVRWSTNEIDAKAEEKVIASIDTHVTIDKSVPIVVFNPLGWERGGRVTVKAQLPDPKQEVSLSSLCEPESNMNQIDPVILSRNETTGEIVLEFDAYKIPALGYKAYRLGPAWKPKKGELGPACVHGMIMPPRQDKLGSFVLENYPDGLSVLVNKISGCITSVKDNSTKTEYVAASTCANQLQLFKDLPKDYDAWNIDPGTLDATPTVIYKADSVELLNEYQANRSIRVTYHYNKSKFVQTISLKGDLIDIDNDVDWHEDHILLKAAFPLAVESDHATYEIPYGTIERPTTRNNSWEKAQFEVPAMRWADLSGKGADGKVHGLSVINDSKYGYDAVGNVLRISLLRSATWPDPVADRGHQHFHYALYPHAGDWKEAGTVRKGWEYNYPLTAVVTTAHAGTLPASHSFGSIDEKNLVLTAVKKAEDSDALIFRAYEFEGKETTATFHVPAGATKATLTNLMEKPEGDGLKVEADKDGSGTQVIHVPVHPFEIVTIAVDYPKPEAAK